MTKHTMQPQDHCWSRLPVYRSGGKLSAEQLTAEQTDSDKRERLLNLALHGWGVVHGFDIAADGRGKIKADNNCIHIGCGLALDPFGRTLYRDTASLRFEDIVGQPPEAEGCYTLKAHYAEKTDAGAWDPCHDGGAWRHRCVVFTLSPCCEAYDPCPRCQPNDTCATRRDYVCARTGQNAGKKSQDPDLALACGDPPPLKSTKCGRFHYDPDAGIPLSCVEICDLTDAGDHCPPNFGFCPCEPPENACDDAPKDREPTQPALQEQGQTAQDTAEKYSLKHPKSDDEKDCDCETSSCNMRPVAYRAPLLYELINDADVDLPRVLKYSWSQWALGKWTTRMPVDVFEDYVLACVAYPDGKHKQMSDADGFVVLFSKPVDTETLHPLSVLFDFYVRENEYDAECDDELVVNWKQSRVPIAIEPIIDPRDPDCAVGVRICPKKAWWSYAERLIKKCASEGQLARAEITLRGQMIRDKCGCMLDARPPELTCRDHCGRQMCRGGECCEDCRNRDPQKTGQARPGGDWVSVFRIGGETDCECDDNRPATSDYRDHPEENDESQDDPKYPETEEKTGKTDFNSARKGDVS